jgi:hypothetical protein
VPTAEAGVSVETGWRVGVTESMADRGAPAVGTSALFALLWPMIFRGVVMSGGAPQQ